MSRWANVVVLATALATVVGCPRAEPPALRERGPQVAQVGERPIFRADVLRARARQRLSQQRDEAADAAGRQQGQALAGSETPSPSSAVSAPAEAGAAEVVQERRLREAVLQELVEQALLARAADAAHVTALSDEVEAAYAQLTAGWNDAALDATLRQLDVTVSEMKAHLRSVLIASKVLRAEALDRVEVRDADIDAFVAENPNELLVPEQLRLRQIVVASQEQVREVQEALKRKTPFEEVAARLSLAPEAMAGGDLGLFARGDLPRQMAEVCFALRPRQMSAPVPAADGLHLFWLSERLPPHRRSVNEIRARIERRLRAEREAEAAAHYLTQLQEEIHVEMHPENLLDVAP